MFSIVLLAMGRLKERFYLDAAAEYTKRLRSYVKFQLTELPEVRLPERPSPAQISAALAQEADIVREKRPKGSWLCVFTPEGRTLSSPEFAATMAAVKNAGCSTACFFIGSSFGIDPSLKQQADLQLSMGRMTFPHHLARIMVLEQLYRAETIQAGAKYHK